MKAVLLIFFCLHLANGQLSECITKTVDDACDTNLVRFYAPVVRNGTLIRINDPSEEPLVFPVFPGSPYPFNIIINDFGSSPLQGNVTQLVREYSYYRGLGLAKNLIIDYTQLANPDCVDAQISNANYIGKCVANFTSVYNARITNRLDFHFICVGFGCHVTHEVIANYNKTAEMRNGMRSLRISGINPGLPLNLSADATVTSQSLQPGDAPSIDITYTSDLRMDESQRNVTVYVNFPLTDHHQPWCDSLYCDDQFGLFLYANSVKSGSYERNFDSLATECENTSQALAGTCSGSRTFVLQRISPRLTGVYQLKNDVNGRRVR